MALVNQEQVKRFAEAVADLPDTIRPLNFYSFFTADGEVVADNMYPPLDHPAVYDFFMFVCLHQYGFWLSDDHGYLEPLYGTLDGKSCKGSDLLWKAVRRYISNDPQALQPERLMKISDQELWQELFCDDNGPIQFAVSKLRTLLTREYGRYLHVRGLTPRDIVEQANLSKHPLKTFMQLMQGVDGYQGDPFGKKAHLLAMALHNRPENLLQVTDHANWHPIVDYHLMRLALRTGMVEIPEEDRYLITRRAFVRPAVEYQIRKATYDAFMRIIELSGRSMFIVDYAAWKARRYCPEMTEPDCGNCSYSPFCAKRTELFQPVYRTTNY